MARLLVVVEAKDLVEGDRIVGHEDDRWPESRVVTAVRIYHQRGPKTLITVDFEDGLTMIDLPASDRFTVEVSKGGRPLS